MRKRTSDYSKRKREENIDEDGEPADQTNPKPAKLPRRDVLLARLLDTKEIQLREHIRLWEMAANHTVLGITVPDGKVAVKRLRCSSAMDETIFSEGFSSEVDLAANLAHPNVQIPIGFVEDIATETYWIISPWESNGNVFEFLATGEWNVSHRTSLVKDLLAGLKYLHTREPPICHGSLTPRNILVNASYRAIISDFTSAHILRKAETTKYEQTRAQDAMHDDPRENAPSVQLKVAPDGRRISLNAPRNLFQWKAPELFSGSPPDLRSDIWSVGWISCEIVTNKPPFYEDAFHLLDSPRPLEWDLAGVGSEEEKSQIVAFCGFTERCCVTDPNKRLTAEQCEMEVNVMSSTIPSDQPRSSARIRSGPLLCEEGRIKYQQNELKKAESLFEEALRVAHWVKETPVILDALAGLGDVFTSLGDHTRAIKCFSEARGRHDRIGNQHGVADSWYGLGEVYRLQGRLAEAEDAFREATAVYTHKPSLANTSFWLGELYRVQNKLKKAQEFFAKAGRLHRTLCNQPDFAKASYWLGYVYFKQLEDEEAVKGGKTVKAFEHARGAVKAFEQARDAYMKIEDMRGVAEASLLLGLVYRLRNNFPSARESFRLAKTKYVDINDQRGLENASFQLSRVEFSYVEAQPLLLEAENIYGLLGDEEGRKRASLAPSTSQIQLLANTRNPSSSGARDSNGRSLVDQGAQAAQVEHPTAQVDHETPAEVPVTAAEGRSFELCSPPVRDMGDLVGCISMSPSFNGGFCDVFKGMYKNGGPVALKRFRNPNNSDVIKRFEREAATWSGLRHNHVLEFMGTLKRDGQFYIVSRFISNGSLRQYVARNPSVSKIKLLCETADGIKYLHTMGVIHGDIKGDNILIDSPERALICDFGLSKIRDSETSTGLHGAGTLLWTSPEVLSGEGKTFSSDVYAFGMTIAEVLADRAPFSHLPHKPNALSLLRAIKEENERPPKEPPSSPEGRSYKAAWATAEKCWPTDDKSRTTMEGAFELLSADPY